MVQKRTVELIDDLDGGVAEATVTFGLDGKTYEIDLSAKNDAKLRKALQPFVEHGRRVGGGRGKKPAATRTTVGASSDTVRQWAAANGYEVSPRGRVARSVMEAFEAANG